MIPPEYWDDPDIDWNEPPEPWEGVGAIIFVMFILGCAYFFGR